MIVLHTLGDTLILVGEKKVRPSSPLVFASLLYLAMERGRRVPRAALQEMLFPESDERSGAHSLRQLLYKLRQLGVPLESDATSVTVPAGQVHDHTSESVTQSGAVAFLPDYQPDISERFSEWLDQKRAETAKAIREQLASAIETHREALNWSAVERDAQLLLNVDPFNEVGTFALAESAALTGRKAAAIKILSDYERETGRTDLRLPSSLLRRRILRAVPEHVATLSALPFVGRDVEVKELRKYIARARSGQPSMYVIGGEAGIGKTRLLTETAALAALEGVAVFTVRCQSHYASRPLSVFIELVPAMRAAPGALGVSPQSLALLNSLTSHADDRAVRTTDTGDDTTRSQALLTAVRDLVDAVATEQPVLIGVEDAHWADPDSLRELNGLVQDANRRLMAVSTTRSPESFPHSAAVDDRTVIRRLKPLASDAMTELAAHLLPATAGQEHGSDVAAWSVRTAGGNPLFLQMLCSQYAATGEANTVPTDVLAAVTRRVEQLPETHRRLLATCALLGKHGTVSVLRDLTGWSHLQLLDVMQSLEEQGYIVLIDERFSVAHDLLVQAVLSLVPPVSKRVLHACVASVLQAQYDVTNDAGLLWDCTEQWVLSGDTTKPIAFLIKCARHALQIGIAAEAIKLLTRARHIARTHADLARVEGELALAAKACAQWVIAAESFSRWNALSRRHEAAEQQSLIELVGLEATWFTTGDPSRVLPIARSYCSQAHDPSRQVDGARILLAMAHEQCDAAIADEAYGFAEPFLHTGSTDHSNRYLPIHYHSVFGDRDKALSLLQRFANDIESFNSRQRLRAASNACAAFAFLGEHRTSHELSLQYALRAEGVGSNAQAHLLVAQAVTALVALDRVEAAKILMARATSLSSDQYGMHDSIHLANLGEIALHDGDRDGASRALERLENLNIASPRFAAYLAGMRVRLAQLDSEFLLESDSAVSLFEWHRRTSRFVSADGLTQAIGVDLVRRGQTELASQLVDNYVRDERRERGYIPKALTQLLRTPCTGLGQDYASLTGDASCADAG